MIIVGSGPSAAGFHPPKNVMVLAVNGAIDWLDRADLWFTLDPSPANIARIKNQRPGCQYYLAINPQRHSEFEGIEGLQLLERFSAGGEQRERLLKTETPQWYLSRWGAVLGLSERIGRIHTGNSMYGALGLAFTMMMFCGDLMGRKIVFVGLDGTQQPRIEGGEPNNLSHLPLLFKSALPQLEKYGFKVVNASPDSLIDCFPRMTHEEAMQWFISPQQQTFPPNHF